MAHVSGFDRQGDAAIERAGRPRLAAGLPDRSGVGLKIQHCREILDTRPDIGWFEVHPENYMGDGGAPHHYLTAIRERYPVSLHGVGLSIGSDAELDPAHLARLEALIERYQPEQFSEHLAWSTHEGVYLNDLLPVPYTAATLERVVRHVDEIQSRLGARMLLENPSTYVRFAETDMNEIDFLKEIAKRTGCGLLLDVNNVHVSATNHGFSATDYIDAFPVELVGEIHLGGFAPDQDGTGAPLLIDAHDRAIADPVWSLYARTIARAGRKPTLIEWDNDVPAWPVLLAEAEHAEAIMRERRSNVAAH